MSGFALASSIVLGLYSIVELAILMFNFFRESSQEDIPLIITVTVPSVLGFATAICLYMYTKG